MTNNKVNRTEINFSSLAIDNTVIIAYDEFVKCPSCGEYVRPNNGRCPDCGGNL